KKVAKRLLAFVGDSQFHLVETLTEKIAEIIVTEFGVSWVKVRLNKRGAIRGARDVGIEIERRAEDYPPPALPHARCLRRRRQQHHARGLSAARARGTEAALSGPARLARVSQSRRRLRRRRFHQPRRRLHDRRARHPRTRTPARNRSPLRPSRRRPEMGATHDGPRHPALRRLRDERKRHRPPTPRSPPPPLHVEADGGLSAGSDASGGEEADERVVGGV